MPGGPAVAGAFDQDHSPSLTCSGEMVQAVELRLVAGAKPEPIVTPIGVLAKPQAALHRQRHGTVLLEEGNGHGRTAINSGVVAAVAGKLLDRQEEMLGESGEREAIGGLCLVAHLRRVLFGGAQSTDGRSNALGPDLQQVAATVRAFGPLPLLPEALFRVSTLSCPTAAFGTPSMTVAVGEEIGPSQAERRQHVRRRAACPAVHEHATVATCPDTQAGMVVLIEPDSRRGSRCGPATTPSR